jgi:release factor glutamine methyltransferase
MDDRQEQKERWTVRRVLAWTGDFLRTKGVDTPRLDAEVLLAHALGVDRLHLYLDLDRPLDACERTAYRDLVRRRAAREPVSLIVGFREFWSLPIKVTQGVLVPRPETEILVERVLAHVADIPAPRILEIGSGTGAISIALARELPETSVVATEVDPVAIRLTDANVRTSDVRGRVHLVKTDVVCGIRAEPLFDVICSNPPYIRTSELGNLPAEVRLFEPRRALDGGEDGLAVVRRIVEETFGMIKASGAIILEIGAGQEDAVAALLYARYPGVSVTIHRDLAGLPRVVQGCMP